MSKNSSRESKIQRHMEVGYTKELAEWNIDQTQRQIDGLSKSNNTESPSLRPDGTDGDEWSDNAWSAEDY